MKTDETEFSEKELYDAARLLIGNVSQNAQALVDLSADSLDEAYIRLVATGKDPGLQELVGIALDAVRLEIPEKYEKCAEK